MNDGAANEREIVALPAPPSLIKEMLRNNRIIQKKEVEMHKTEDIADTERLWTGTESDIAMGTVSES